MASYTRLLAFLSALAPRRLRRWTQIPPPRKRLLRRRNRRVFLEPLEGRSLLAAIAWTGTTNTDWATAANWSPSQVPTSADDVTINDVANDPILDSNRSVGSLQGSGLIDLSTFVLTIGEN